MAKKLLNDLLARRFLLGQLSPEEQESIAELAFEDPESFTYIQAAQDELIDDFLDDELSSDEKKSFREYFLIQPGRRQDLRIARALRKYLTDADQTIANVVDTTVRPKVSFFDLGRQRALTRAFVIAALILAAAVGLLLVIRALRRSDNPPLEAKQQETPALPTPNSSPTATLVQATPSPVLKGDQPRVSPSPRIPTAPVFAVVLDPGAPSRSPGTEKTFPLPPGPTSLELPLIDDTPYQSYHAVLQTDSETIRQWPDLKPKELQAGRGINILVPAGLLKKSQRYRITLEGITATGNTQLIDNYYFAVN